MYLAFWFFCNVVVGMFLSYNKVLAADDTEVIDEVSLTTHTVLPFLITFDGYEVSGKYLRTYTVTNPNINDENGMTSVETVVGPTITKVAAP